MLESLSQLAQAMGYLAFLILSVYGLFLIGLAFMMWAIKGPPLRITWLAIVVGYLGVATFFYQYGVARAEEAAIMLADEQQREILQLGRAEARTAIYFALFFFGLSLGIGGIPLITGWNKLR